MEKKKMAIYSIVALVALALLVVGATYAYFQNQYGASSNADVKVTTYTTDVLTFETGSNISITAGQDDFASGKGNKTGSTFARATLQANNKTNTATANYYMYLNIETNTFTYTNTDKPELVLQVINKTTGKPVTSITGLNYVTVTDGKNTSISGFDITTKNGLIALFSNKVISASPKTIEEYTITITLVNHNFDQNVNTGKNLNGKLIIQKEKMITSISDVAKSGDALATVLETLGTKGDPSLTGLYHHDANLTNGAGDNSYRFAGASDQVNNYVCFGSSITPCPADNLYRIIGVFGDRVKLIKSDYATSTLLGTDGDYGRKYNFGKSTYKGNNYDNIVTYAWNYKNDTSINSGNGSNTWSTSLLNKTNLNTNFITNIGADWAAKIADTTWKVGGNTWSNIGSDPAKTAYQNEIVNPKTTGTSDNKTEYSAKIGLMYASDYGFAAAPSAWTTPLSSYDVEAIKNVNWMYMGLEEWTLSRDADYFSHGFYSQVFYVDYAGKLYFHDAIGAYGVRPVFYFSSSVNYASGSGSATDPIRLS